MRGKKPWPPVWALTALTIFLILFLLLGFLRSESGLIHAFDTGLYLQLLSNLQAGRGWDSSITGESFFLAHHFQPALGLLIPVHSLFPSSFALLMINGIVIAGTSVFLMTYLPAHGLASQRAAVVVGLALLVHPTLASRIYYSFVPEVLALPALAYLACRLAVKEPLSRRSWALVLAALIFTGLCKETLWLTCAGIAFLMGSKANNNRENRYFKALALAWIAGFAYLFLVWMPQHSTHAAYYGLSYYDNSWIAGRWGLAGKALGGVLNIMSLQSLETAALCLLILPMGMPLFGGYRVTLACLPALLLILAATNSQIHVLTNHYLIGVAPFVAVASAIGLDRLLNRFSEGAASRYLRLAVVIVPVAITAFHGSGFIFQVLFAVERKTPGLREATEQLKVGLKVDEPILIDGSLQPFFADFSRVKVILGFQGNPMQGQNEDFRETSHVITANDLEDITDCRSLKPGADDNTIFDYEGFYRYCDWIKTSRFDKKVYVPKRLIHLKPLANGTPPPDGNPKTGSEEETTGGIPSQR